MTDSASLHRARAAKTRAHAVFSELADVVGVGITTIGSEYGLKINLGTAPATTSQLPTEVDGVPVRIEVVGTIRKRGRA